MIDLQRHGDVFVLTMTEGENRWNTTFVRAFTFGELQERAMERAEVDSYLRVT